MALLQTLHICAPTPTAITAPPAPAPDREELWLFLTQRIRQNNKWRGMSLRDEIAPMLMGSQRFTVTVPKVCK